MPVNQICENCGSEIAHTAIYCPFCGSNMKFQRKGWTDNIPTSNPQIKPENNAIQTVKDQSPTLDTQISRPEKKRYNPDMNYNAIEKYQAIEDELKDLSKIGYSIQQQQAYVKSLQNDLEQSKSLLDQLHAQTMKEFKDVEDLQKLSFASLKARWKGNKDKVMEKEEREYYEALNKEQALIHDREDSTKKFQIANTELQHLYSLLERKKFLKEELIRVIDEACEGVPDPIEDPIEQELARLKKEMEPLIQDRIKLRNALSHLQNGLIHFQEALDVLQSAKSLSNWDTFFGGGFFVDSAKHSRVADARNAVQNAGRSIQLAFSIIPNLPRISIAQVNQSSFFWDTFMDNIFSDLKARRMIRESYDSVYRTTQETQNAIAWTQNELNGLESHYQNLNQRIQIVRENLTAERIRMIKQALG